MPEGTGLKTFADAYPERFFDVGIAEQHSVTFAAGMATEGYHPVVAIYSTFLQRAYDQILHDVCLDALPVVFAIDRGGLVGEDGPTHHGAFDLSYLRSLPNMVVMAPKDENELRSMLKTALHHDGPIAVRYPRAQGIGVPKINDIEPIPIGKGEVLCHGDDLILLAIGNMVHAAMRAKDDLKKEGFSPTVVNCRFVKPLDADLIIDLANRIPRMIILEENVLSGGFGSAVLECLSDAGLTGVQVKRLGLPDQFIEHGSPDLLRSQYGIDRTGIVRSALSLLHASHGR